MGGFLTKLFSAGASTLVEAVGDAIDKNFTTDEERKTLENELAKARMQYELENKHLDVEETKAYLADTDSARENQTRIQESIEASWLAKNVHSILALGIVGTTFAMYAWIISKGDNFQKLQQSGMKDIIIYILGALTTVSTQVASYFFGSSHGSAAKDKRIDNIAIKKN